MKKKFQTTFSTRQYMLAKDFEIYYYSTRHLSKVENHTHSYYEFYFFLEGDVTMIIEDSSFLLKRGDVVLIPPGIHHYAVINSHEQPYRRFVLWISVDFCNRLLALSPDYVYLMQRALVMKKYIFHNDIIAFNAIQSKVFRLIEEIHSDRFGHASQVSVCVNDLLLHLNRQAHERENPKDARSGQNLYQNLLYYIEDHLEEELSLEKLSSVFYVSKYHIAHVFKENTGLSVHQYILKKRLSACYHAILSGEGISEVCLQFGFKEYSSFYRAFKKEFGISPRECRHIQSRAENLSGGKK